MSVLKLNNVIQNYAWGSKHSISQLFGVQNPDGEPQAEIWMGAHPNGCSRIMETNQLLSEFIQDDMKKVLGDYTARRFGELPYLFKVLAAETPLSIQVHPSKRNAESGFARENDLQIDIDAANRNYKDPNHKPELVYALTYYKAMNGFRPVEQIVELFNELDIPSLENEVSLLTEGRDSESLKQFFKSIMSLASERKTSALKELYKAYQRPAKTPLHKEALDYSISFSKHYPDDIGLFAPFMLNTIELAPGEAMFLDAETPHAYVEGTGLEVMANSDNVLRAGLTPKYIDTEELVANTRFESIEPENIKLMPLIQEGKLSFPVPVDDFSFDILFSEDIEKQQFVRSAEIVFCIEGKINIDVDNVMLELNKGESAIISCEAQSFIYSGIGLLARVYN